jgi:hypothetical protein
MRKYYDFLTPDGIAERLNTYPLTIDSPYYHRVRSYSIAHYWLPLRASEIYERTIEEIEVTSKKVIFHLVRKKKKYRDEEDEPVSIPIHFKLVDELVNYLTNPELRKEWDTKKNKRHRPWKISIWTSRNYIKEVFEDAYPHFWRFYFITDRANDPLSSIVQLQSKTRLTLVALQKYIKTTEKAEEEVVEVDTVMATNLADTNLRTG